MVMLVMIISPPRVMATDCLHSCPEQWPVSTFHCCGNHLWHLLASHRLLGEAFCSWLDGHFLWRNHVLLKPSAAAGTAAAIATVAAGTNVAGATPTVTTALHSGIMMSL